MWSKVKNASSYNIYRAVENNDSDEYELIENTTSTKFIDEDIDTEATTYYYKVCPVSIVDDNTYEGKYTSSLCITTPLSKVKVSSSQNQKGKKIVLKWKKSSNVSGYEIFCSKNYNSYKKIAVIKKNTTTSYTHKKLSKNSTYLYQIRAYKIVDGKKIYSKYSKFNTVKVLK